MKVRMVVGISGTRDGQDWPPAGGVADVPKDQAADLLAAGLAVEATAGEPPVEAAVAPEPMGKATLGNTPRRRKG